MLRIALYILAAIYPVLIFCSLVILKIPLRYFSIFVIFVAGVIFLFATSSKKNAAASPQLNDEPRPEERGITPPGTNKKQGLPFRAISAVLFGAGGLGCLLSNQALFLKLYPVLMNAVMLGAFGISLFVPPPMIFRFAVLMDKSIRGSLAEKRIERYCRTVTLVWCIFFIINGGIAAWTVFSASDFLWSVYNGGISYILTGILFAGEFIIRKITDKKMPRAVPLSQFIPASRSPAYILCYDQDGKDAGRKTWGDFLEDTALFRRALRQDSAEKWMLDTDDYWYFLCAFTALCQCKKEIHLSTHISPAHIQEIWEDGKTGFLTDRLPGKEDAAGPTVYIPALFDSSLPPEAAAELQSVPQINADDTRIVVYAPGTAGQPRALKRRLTELENDNRFFLSKYGEEWLSFRVFPAVRLHPVYGPLYGILLPFTAGIPFRRRRIENSEEFELPEAPSVKGCADTIAKTDIPAARCLSRIDIIEQSPLKITLEFSVPAESDYFNEHFPQLKVLPAVAQFELAIHFADRYLGAGLELRGARRLKFSSLVRPGVPLRLELLKSSPLITFTYSSPNGQTVYSSGTFTIQEGNND